MSLLKSIPLLAIFISRVWAQFPMAHCASGFDWNKNSLGQDPCTVGSMLDASCRGLSVYTYPPLNASQYYLPPRTNHSGDLMCDCNTVMYSLYMACTSCQSGEVYSWLQWIPECTSVYISQYPVDIAQGTDVPHWAYYNWTSSPTEIYNDTVALSIGRDPEATPPAVTIATSSLSGPKSTITRTSNGLPEPTDTNSPKGGANVPAIVGGVVGSIVPLTILGVVAFLYFKHKNRNQKQQPQPMPDLDPYGQRPVSYGAPPMPSIPFTPYNPSDPSTFPTHGLADSVTYTTQPSVPRGAYSGMPEV